MTENKVDSSLLNLHLHLIKENQRLKSKLSDCIKMVHVQGEGWHNIALIDQPEHKGSFEGCSSRVCVGCREFLRLVEV